MRQVRAVASVCPGPIGSKLDFRIARNAGLANILWVLSVTTAREILPFARILKHTVASPSILSRRAMLGYLGNAVSAGTLSVFVSVKCRTMEERDCEKLAVASNDRPRQATTANNVRPG